jgi:diaminopimelate decarboxylase
MDYFNYKNGELYAEKLKVADLAEKHGTPLYIYSKATLERHYRAFERALKEHGHLVCYSVKSNSNLAVIATMAKLGSGFDVVSEGELRRVKAAGGDLHKAVFSGVGKTRGEIAYALSEGIRCLNVESEEELGVVSEEAKKAGIVAPVALRINPDVDAKTLPAISTGLRSNKFGVWREDAVRLYKRIAADPNLKASGLDCHIGSQMTSSVPILEAADIMIDIYKELLRDGIKVDHIDLGGGLGVTYDEEQPPSPDDFFSGIIERFRDLDCDIYVEPGRAMVANAGIFVCRALYQKDNGDKHFVITDGSMSDLIRPALYGAYMTIENAVERKDAKARKCDVVGPVCESDDFLGKERMLDVRDGDILAVRGAGAYGSSMSSCYNSRRLCAEVMVDGSRDILVRRRQTFEQMWENEAIAD